MTSNVHPAPSPKASTQAPRDFSISDSTVAGFVVANILQAVVIHDCCIMRLVARMRFNDGLAPAQSAEAITTYIAEHNERWLLAFVFGELGSNNALSIESEVQKHLVLVTLALVECIAEARAH